MDHSRKTSSEPTTAGRASDAEEKILLFLATAVVGSSSDGVASHMKLGTPQAELILVFLEEQGLVRHRHAAAVSMMQLPNPSKWALTPAARQYIAKWGLMN